MPKVMIAIPTYSRKIHAMTTMSLLRTMAALPEHGWAGVVQCQVGDALLPRCRNKLVADFKASDADDLFFIDDDVQWDPEDFVALLRRPEEFVCGVYRVKEEAVRFPVDWANPLNWADGLVEAVRVPFGFVRLKRSVVEKMWRLPHKRWVEGGLECKELFSYSVHAEMYWGEDYIFCNKWRGGGGQIWVDPEIELTHYGDFGFTGKPSRFLEKPMENVALTVGIATRGRPEKVLNTIRSYERNTVLERTRIAVLVDEDDVSTVERLSQENFDSRVVIDVAPRDPSQGDKWNRMLRVCPAGVYMAVGDYPLMKTRGYDRRVVEGAKLFPDGIGCVYGPPANASFPTFQAPTARLVEMLGGKIYPSYFPFWFTDHWLDDVCQMIDRISPVEVEYDWVTQKPANTHEMRDVAFWAAFFDAISFERIEQSKRIIQAPEFEEAEWRKKILLKNWVRIEVRSQYLNSMVRANAEEIEKARGEKAAATEHYLKLKQAAVEKLKAIRAGGDRELAA